MRLNIIEMSQVKTILLITIIYAVPSSGQNFLAVMDLVSDNSISKKGIIAISDKISQSITDSKYSQFDRLILPELLSQLNIEEPFSACYNPQCLILAGSMIGANTIIGGFVSHNNNGIDIRLNLVDVKNKITLNIISVHSTSQKKAFMETEIPEIIKKLFSPSQNVNISSSTDNSKKKKTIFSRPPFYGGIAIIGLIGAGAIYYYQNYYKTNQSNSDEDPPLSMDGAPVRIKIKGE